MKKIKNQYFFTNGNKNNLAFIFALIKILKLKKKIFFKIINNFKGLKYRQQIVFNSKKITFINDSKATSFSSSLDVLEPLNKVFWIVGGIPKLGDKFLMKKNKYKNIKAYIFGRNKNYFIKQFKNKIDHEIFYSLEEATRKIIFDIKNIKTNKHKTVLFSPAAASFDSFKNFEDRGNKFNIIIKKLNVKKLDYS